MCVRPMRRKYNIGAGFEVERYYKVEDNFTWYNLQIPRPIRMIIS